MPVLKKYNAASGLWQAVGGMGLPQTPVSFSAHNNSVTQSMENNIDSKLTFTTLDFNNGAGYNTTNNWFKPSIAGCYLVNVCVRYQGMSDGKIIVAIVRKNGATYKLVRSTTGTSSAIVSAEVTCLVYMNGTTDYLEAYGYQNSGTTITVDGGSFATYFQGCLIPDSYDSTKQIVDLSSATSDYLLGVGETAKVMYSGVTSCSLHVKTEEGVYELTIDQPYVTTNSVEGGVGLSPNETTYSNSFVFSESRTDNLINVADGVASFTGWHNGATCSNFPIGYPYIMAGKYRISTKTNSKSIIGQCVRLGGTTAPLTMQNEVFSGIWKDTTTVWSSLGKITFPYEQSGTVLIKRIA